MKVNQKVKILKLDMEDSLYKGYPSMKEFKGKTGIFIEDSPFRDGCIHIIIASRLWVLRKEDVKKYD